MRKEVVQCGCILYLLFGVVVIFLGSFLGLVLVVVGGGGDFFLGQLVFELIVQLLCVEFYFVVVGCFGVGGGVVGVVLGIDNVCELVVWLFFSIVEWVCYVFFFFELLVVDQVVLLCLSWSEFFVLNVVQVVLFLYMVLLLVVVGFYVVFMVVECVVVFMDQVWVFQEQVDKLGCLQVDLVEYGCFKVIVFFMFDVCGFLDLVYVESLQEKVQVVFIEYVWVQYLFQFQCFGCLLLWLFVLCVVFVFFIFQLFFMCLVGKMFIEILIRDMLLLGSIFNWFYGLGQ